ncbi:MAG: pentapeptide repeat-containing protein [Nitrospiraceae bacterium]
MRTDSFSYEALKGVLQAHGEWLQSNGSTGERADLRSAVLRRVELPHVNLSRALLDSADLSGASLPGANLSGASLVGANLTETCLTEANLSKAHLVDANLSHAELVRSDLSGACLNGARLRHAGLQEANLAGAVGLSVAQLAGTNLSGTTMPEGVDQFESLTYVGELSKKAGALLTTMLMGCAYACLTIATTTDARLLTNSRTSPLPIIQADIPIAGFYWLAPAALVALYIYFHLYVLRLWHYLADLPAIFPDGRPLDERAYPWLPNGIVRKFVGRLRLAPSFVSAFEVVASAILVWWLVPLTLVLFWLRYLTRHDWNGTLVHIVLLSFTFACALWLQRQARSILQGRLESPAMPDSRRARSLVTKTTVGRAVAFLLPAGAVCLLLLLVSDGAMNDATDESAAIHPARFTEAPHRWAVAEFRSLTPSLLQAIGFRTHANLVEQDVSSKPENWFLRDEADLIRIVHGAQLKRADLRRASAMRAFMVKADLREADLRQAKLVEAQLQGADLRGARLERANLRRAYLQGVRFGVLKDANTRLLLEKTQELLEKSVTALEKLTDIGIAQVRVMQESLEVESQLMRLEEDEDLQPTDLQQANLNFADLSDADLRGVHLEQAVMIGAQLQRAKLMGALLKRADLSRANLHKADLRAAVLSGASLHHAQLQSANLEYAIDLTQGQLDGACVDKDTRLPPHLMRPKPCSEILQESSARDEVSR